MQKRCSHELAKSAKRCGSEIRSYHNVRSVQIGASENDQHKADWKEKRGYCADQTRCIGLEPWSSLSGQQYSTTESIIRHHVCEVLDWLTQILAMGLSSLN